MGLDNVVADPFSDTYPSAWMEDRARGSLLIVTLPYAIQMTLQLVPDFEDPTGAVHPTIVVLDCRRSRTDDNGQPLLR